MIRRLLAPPGCPSPVTHTPAQHAEPVRSARSLRRSRGGLRVRRGRRRSHFGCACTYPQAFQAFPARSRAPGQLHGDRPVRVLRCQEAEEHTSSSGGWLAVSQPPERPSPEQPEQPERPRSGRPSPGSRSAAALAGAQGGSSAEAGSDCVREAVPRARVGSDPVSRLDLGWDRHHHLGGGGWSPGSRRGAPAQAAG